MRSGGLGKNWKINKRGDVYLAPEGNFLPNLNIKKNFWF